MVYLSVCVSKRIGDEGKFEHGMWTSESMSGSSK